MTTSSNRIPFDGANPRVADTAWVAPTAMLVGRVEIAEDAVVMFGAVLRADRAEIIVGAGSNVQDTAVLHGDPGRPVLVGADVSIGHGAVVHGCTVEDGCLIGMRAVVLNGAVIGAGSLVAAGAVVLEGTLVPAGSLVAGVPAKVRRMLTEEERAGIAENACTYVELGRRYRSA